MAAEDLRRHLQGTTSSSSVAYGYTLSISGSALIAHGELGPPGLSGVLALIAGAVVAFAIVEAAAYGSLKVEQATETPPVAIWGNAHLLSAGLAVLAVQGLLVLHDGAGAWALCGFIATVVYLLVTAVQAVLAERRTGEGAGRP